MEKPGKKDDRRSAKDSRAVGLLVVQEVETTKRKQIEHRTLQTLIWAIALSLVSAKPILLLLVSRWT